MAGKRLWEPLKSAVEAVPDAVVVSYEQPGIMAAPHWHAQIEVNFVFRGAMHYRMQGYEVELKAGDLCLFWGGLPHQVVDTADDTLFTAIHLPLVHFFRLRLRPELASTLMQGASVITRSEDGGDEASVSRWIRYLSSGDTAQQQHAIAELLLRFERLSFEPFVLRQPEEQRGRAMSAAGQSASAITAICGFIAGNFRQDIGSAEIARFADMHPKYAMSLFKKSTGMTLNEYINLLRLSYAQSLLFNDDANILDVALDSGFGSLSNFNKSFRRIAGMSPTDFRHNLHHLPVGA